MRRNTNSLLIVLTLAFGIMLASSISTASVVVFAQQKNQTNTGASSSGGNQTTTNVAPAGKEATRIINQTSIPANQTTTTVQKKTEPVGNVSIPSSNQLKLSPPGSQAKLPSVSNKTTVAPTGQATTTIINQTSTPLNVTSTNATTAAKQPQTAPSPTNQTAGAPATTASQTPPSSSSSGGGGGGSTNQTGATQQSSNSSSGNPLSK